VEGASTYLRLLTLEELTERVQAAAQIRWLQARGWRYEIGANGHPRVLRAEQDRHMLSGPLPRQRKTLNMPKAA